MERTCDKIGIAKWVWILLIVFLPVMSLCLYIHYGKKSTGVKALRIIFVIVFACLIVFCAFCTPFQNGFIKGYNYSFSKTSGKVTEYVFEDTAKLAVLEAVEENFDSSTTATFENVEVVKRYGDTSALVDVKVQLEDIFESETVTCVVYVEYTDLKNLVYEYEIKTYEYTDNETILNDRRDSAIRYYNNIYEKSV